MAFTRAASAANSHRAKKELVRVLFGPQSMRRGPEAHRLLDYSIYTHTELKSAYLKRVQELHPDKRRNETKLRVQETRAASRGEGNDDDEFILLQDAWRRYEEYAKILTKVGNGSRDSAFTMFGVGCSFSDNEAERERRNEITDQACRGWFSAGEIGHGSGSSSNSSTSSSSELSNPRTAASASKQNSLLDDNWFEPTETRTEGLQQSTTGERRKSLIDHMMRSKR